MSRPNFKLIFEKYELGFLLLLFVVTTFFRFYQLGYSHFYGDETKALYLRKDVAASDFLLNQRKGPVQFLAVWGAEKTFGGYDELTTRIPFAVASVASVFAFYVLVRLLFGFKSAAFASLLFALNGFFIGFGRTVQYQSLLLLFGFLALIFTVLYARAVRGSASLSVQRCYLVLIGITYGLAFLTHWDAVFYAFVTLAVLVNLLLTSTQKPKVVFEVVVFLVLPFLLVMGMFFVPYFAAGNFEHQIWGYMRDRITGKEYLPSNSIYTFMVYNFSSVFLFPVVFAVIALVRNVTFAKILMVLWFVCAFYLIELLFENPGTHIYNYVIPLIILAGVGIAEVLGGLTKPAMRAIFGGGLVLLFAFMFAANLTMYIPRFNTGYPWIDSAFGPFYVEKAKKDRYQLFLYGFPYYRGWDHVRDYFALAGNPRSFYTNDNVTIGQYYLQGVSVHKPKSERQYPEYYILVKNSQEPSSILSFVTLDVEYVLEKSFSEGIEVYRIGLQ